MRVLILGVNGFIGNSLVRAILDRTDWEVRGLDLDSDKLDHSLGDPRFEFTAGDITLHHGWVDRQIERADVVVPLVAIATPIAYVKTPLSVFELTFEENLRIVRRCVKYGTRVVFPSSSEVYGMSTDETFNEDGTPFVLGPVRNQRWIYACSKQLLDRVIWAYGASGRLRFTLFRPFNWIGPRLDDPRVAKEGSSRVVSQFISDLLAERPIRLVDGGEQRRCFTYIDDGIDCLLSILDNRGGLANGEIFNIGNPANECSMRELARRLSRLFRLHPLRRGRSRPEEPVPVASDLFYGEGYEDIWARKPDIDKARELLGWTPKVGLDEALQRTLDDVLGAPTGHPLPLASAAATTAGRTRGE